MKTLVMVQDVEGKIRYRRLLDDGSNVLRFASGYGFVKRDDMVRDGCKIIPMTCERCGLESCPHAKAFAAPCPNPPNMGMDR